MSSALSFSRDSTSGRAPRRSCFTRRDTTLIRMFGSLMTFWASRMYSSLMVGKLGGIGVGQAPRASRAISPPGFRLAGGWFRGDIPAMFMAWSTTAKREDADRRARGAVEAHLAACAQVEGPITSHYCWEGKVEQAEEFRICFKYLPANASQLS